MPHPMMYESRAQGGPLDGVKIQGPLSWDGRVASRHTDGFVHYHQGYYRWNPLIGCWEWHVCKQLRESAKAHNKQVGLGSLTK